MSEQFQVFHDLFYLVCACRAEVTRLLAMRQAYPRFEGLFSERRAGELLSSSGCVLNDVDDYRRTETVPPPILLQPLYAKAVEMVEELERIDRESNAVSVHDITSGFSVDLGNQAYVHGRLAAARPLVSMAASVGR